MQQQHSDILIALALILVAGKVASHLGQRLGLPSAVGKIAVGLLIGPALFGVIGDSPTLDVLSNVGVILLMFLAGLETDMGTMRRVSVPAFAVATGGVVLPFAGGFALGEAFHLGLKETLFLSAILTATSVSISAQTLRELGRLQTKEGTTILTAAVIDDVMGIIVLAFVFALTGGGDPWLAIGKMALFLPLSFGVGYVLSGPLSHHVDKHLSQEAQLSVVIAAALVFAWAAEHFGGIAAVTGAYMAGILVARTKLTATVSEGLNWIGDGFFVPLFFVGIGLKADFRSLADAPFLVLALLGIAIVAKVVGCYMGARLCRFAHRESLSVGVGMMSRGEVALVIAAAGLAAGAVDGAIFSAAIVMTLVTTILTPIFLKLTYTEEPVPQADMSPTWEAASI
jgi:Na+:H+ antiporter